MPVTVPSEEDLADLEHKAAEALQAQQAQLDALAARVTALENAEPVPPDPPDPPPSTGTVTVRMGGTDYAYDPAQGTDIGSYHDPAGRFVMSCVRVQRDDCRLVLDFRATDQWSCIVFEHSDPLNLSLIHI